MSPMMTTKHLLDVALKEIERLKKKLQQERNEFLEDLDKIRKYSDKWDYNIPKLFWETIKKWEKIRDGK